MPSATCLVLGDVHTCICAEPLGYAGSQFLCNWIYLSKSYPRRLGYGTYCIIWAAIGEGNYSVHTTASNDAGCHPPIGSLPNPSGACSSRHYRICCRVIAILLRILEVQLAGVLQIRIVSNSTKHSFHARLRRFDQNSGEECPLPKLSQPYLGVLLRMRKR